MFRTTSFTTTTSDPTQYPHGPVHSANVLKILYVTCFAVFVIVNVLSKLGAIGHGDTAEIAAKYPTLITPAAWSFTIWGLLITLQGIFVVYQALPFQHYYLDLYLHRMHIFLPLAWLFESAWLFAFSYENLWLSLIFMACSYLSLLIAYFRLQTYPLRFLPLVFTSRHYFAAAFYWKRRYEPILETAEKRGEVSLAFSEKMRGIAHYFLVFVPVSLNLGWLAVAFLINLAITIPAVNADVPCILLLCIGGLLGLVHIWWKSDIWYALAIIWGYVGIAVARSAEHIIGHTAWVFVGVLAVMSVSHLLVQVYWIVIGAQKREPQIVDAGTTYTFASL